MKNTSNMSIRMADTPRLTRLVDWIPQRLEGMRSKAMARAASLAAKLPAQPASVPVVLAVAVVEDEHATSLYNLPGWHGGIHWDEAQCAADDTVIINPTTGLPVCR